MTLDQKLTAALAQLAMLVCLVGLIRTGRWRLCVAFVGYVLAILTLGPLQTWWPSRFNTWEYWTFKETVYGAFKLAVAAELAMRVCRWFPGAKVSTERWVLGVLVLTAGGIILAPFTPDFILDVTGELMARVAIGTLWLLVATSVAIRHYRLPVHPFHMALIVGCGAHLAAFGFLLRLIQVWGWSVYPYVNSLAPPAYLTFAVWVAWVSWRRDGAATETYEHIVVMVKDREAVA